MSRSDAIRTTIRAYADAWAARNRDAWLETFASDATQEDPVGDLVRRGPAEIGRFWDDAMARYRSIEIVLHDVFVVGREAAMVWTINGVTAEGAVTFSGVDVFRFDENARITSVRAFWDRAALHTQFGQLRGRAEAGGAGPIPSTVMRSNRLELRPLVEDDAPFVESFYSMSEVTQTLLKIQRPISAAEAKEFCAAHPASDVRFVATRRDDGKMIGFGTVLVSDDGPVRRASIGYAVLPACWGQGFATEVAGVLVRFATDVGCREVLATTLEENAASGRVLEKLGFTVAQADATETDSRDLARRVTRWIRDASHGRSADAW